MARSCKTVRRKSRRGTGQEGARPRATAMTDAVAASVCSLAVLALAFSSAVRQWALVSFGFG